MKLTKKEYEMLDGKCGKAVQKSMQLLVALGECYGAKQMIPIASVHLSGVNPVTSGKGGTLYIKEMLEKGGRFVVPTTTNPGSVEPWLWRKMGFTEGQYREQVALSEDIAKLGGIICNTCTPYLVGYIPRIREHVAWCESSAIAYANAVLGCRSNKEGGPSALAAALTGRTPAYGYHLDENRRGRLKIQVNTTLKGETDYATLGYFVGEIAQDRIPVFSGIPKSVSQHELKCLGTGLTTCGIVSHYHVIGVTPEAPTEEIACGYYKIGPSDVVEFGAKHLKESERALCNTRLERVNLVVLGCPHPSIEQLRNYAEALAGKTVKKGVEVWIQIAHSVKDHAERLGYVKTIESSGARLVSNCCVVIMPKELFKRQGYEGIATDAPKIAHYVSRTKDVPCYYSGLKRLIRAITI